MYRTSVKQHSCLCGLLLGEGRLDPPRWQSVGRGRAAGAPLVGTAMLPAWRPHCGRASRAATQQCDYLYCVGMDFCLRASASHVSRNAVKLTLRRTGKVVGCRTDSEPLSLSEQSLVGCRPSRLPSVVETRDGSAALDVAGAERTFQSSISG